MEITVQRNPDDGKSVLGKLSIDTDPFTCFTLEPSKTDTAHPTTPAGRYQVKLLFSSRFQETTPHIMDVPGRSFIEVHPGNDPEDTEGCTLVGESEAIDWVGSSRVAFQALMAVLNKDSENLWITYVNASNNQ